MDSFGVGPVVRARGAAAMLRCAALGWMAIAATTAHSAILLMDFSNNAGLGYGVGTTQTITQNGVQMSVLAGKYEITLNPFHELNLKDFDVGTRTVRFGLVSGLNFDFIGLVQQSSFGDVTITSSRGGSIVFNRFTAALDFSGPQWDDVAWIDVSSSTRLGEYKFGPFTFDDAPTVAATVPEPGTLALVGLGALMAGRLRRRANPPAAR